MVWMVIIENEVSTAAIIYRLENLLKAILSKYPIFGVKGEDSNVHIKMNKQATRIGL